MMRAADSTRSAALAVATAGVLIGVGGVLHPQADTALTYDAARAGAMQDGLWTAAHGLTLAGTTLLAGALAVLTINLAGGLSPRVRTLAWAVVAGAAIAAIELVPHTIMSAEADELLDGASTPLITVHEWMQLVANPALGFSIAALAAASAPARSLGAGRIAAVLGVVGGLAFGLAGPLVTITEDPAVSALYAGGLPMSLWLVVAGVRTARRPAATPELQAEVAQA